MTKTSMMQAIWAAPARLPRFSQVSKIEKVSVCTPRNSTAPMSFSVSIATSVRPIMIAGRAIGIWMRKNTFSGPAPSVRATSAAARPCIRNIERQAR
ncbi:hypothetical protein D9M72_605060 [compost metagenome]